MPGPLQPWDIKTINQTLYIQKNTAININIPKSV